MKRLLCLIGVHDWSYSTSHCRRCSTLNAPAPSRIVMKNITAGGDVCVTSIGVSGPRPTHIPNGAKVHDLKAHPEPFDAMERGDKVHEFRRNDRGFRVGDYIRLRRWDPVSQTYTGAELTRRITYVGTGFGIPDGFVCLSVQP